MSSNKPETKAACQQSRRQQATPARLLALDVTRQLRQRQAYAHDLVKKQVQPTEISDVERDFASLLIYGVAATSGELDILLHRALQGGSSGSDSGDGPRCRRIKPKLLDALRISCYELFFLQKPAHIAVSQGVELMRSFAPYAVGFANKLLRETAKLREEFPFGDASSEPQAMAHQHGFPLWLAERLIDALGIQAAEQLMLASNQQAPLFLADLRDGSMVEAPPAELQVWLPRIEAGELIVADAAAQQVAALATPPPGGSFLEVGSGRGTKTVLIQHAQRRALAQGCEPDQGNESAQDCEPTQNPDATQYFALDLHPFKQEVLLRRAQQYQLRQLQPVTGDATALGKHRLNYPAPSSGQSAPASPGQTPPLPQVGVAFARTGLGQIDSESGTEAFIGASLDELINTAQLPEEFSAALIDAPCSGTGTLRRHPEIRWRLQPEDVTAMAEQGLAMLEAVAHCIEPGGFVVYSTCSVLSEENELLIERFLAGDAGQGFEQAGEPFRSRLYPGSSDAHFAVKLVKRL
jgi:16S rRNA (cytosine967-C5)-methyltransferase